MLHFPAGTLGRALIPFTVVGCLLLSSSHVVCTEKKPASENAESKKPAVPVFLPGAKVTVEATFALPPGYEFGEDPAVVYTFDAKTLKKHPFAVSPLEWKFTREQLEVKLTDKGECTQEPARLSLRVKKDAAYGDHLLPAMLRVDFCSKEGGFCTWTELPVEFRIRVGMGKQALRKGTLRIHTSLTEQALLGGDS